MDEAANPRQAQGQNRSLWESEDPVQLRSRGARTLPLASSAMAAQGRRCLSSGFPSGLPAPFPNPVPAELWGSGFLGVGWGIWQCDLSVPCVTPAGDGAWCASTCPCSCILRHRDVAAEASGSGDVHPPAPTAAAQPRQRNRLAQGFCASEPFAASFARTLQPAGSCFPADQPFPAWACWRWQPGGRAHCSVTARGRGDTSP